MSFCDSLASTLRALSIFVQFVDTINILFTHISASLPACQNQGFENTCTIPTSVDDCISKQCLQMI